MIAFIAAAVVAGIHVNQVGFTPAAPKLAVVSAGAAARFAVVDAASGTPVLDAALGPAAPWDASGETVRIADFSALHQAGRYRLRVAGLPDSAPFSIDAAAYRDLDAAALRTYYYQRAGIALEPRFSGAYARAAGHLDMPVQVHPSAASKERPAGTIIKSPGGWYDAGDYNEYIVNAGISTYTLLAAYAHFPDWFGRLQVHLPESGNGLPDVLNEALWNLAWMRTMQDPHDGGVYHKLTNLAFDPPDTMPDQARTPRYVVQKTTAAALDFAAVMATASRVLAPFDRQAPGRSQGYLAAAEAAWRWARLHPGIVYQQPADVLTGTYGDAVLDDEWEWAAAELFITTGKREYQAQAMLDGPAGTAAPTWSSVRPLAWMSLADSDKNNGGARRQIVALADTFVAHWRASPYRITMQGPEMVWGSNAVILNQAMMLVQAYRITPTRAYLDAAQSDLDYVLGRNAVGRSFVTGFGATPPLHPHHRPSNADGIAAPVPGLLVGGPNPGQQDVAGCTQPYPSMLPALSYLDDACSYASNEIAINWNAPLVYVAAALQALQPR